MPKNTKIISLSVYPETEVILKKEAERRGITVSALIRQILEMVPIERDDLQLVVLQIPKTVMQEQQLLENWLASKCKVLLKKVFPS